MAADLILLMGPTGAGKTAIAFELAARRPIEIVSVDSTLVYRRMDIGSAKPSQQERQSVPHHLIDILDPDESYSVGQFLRQARQAIEGIRARGRMPLLAGGTMLYFHALSKGLAELPEGDAQVRREIDARATNEGWPALHAELASVDPEAAARIHHNDPQRIQRALEVYRLTGVPVSRLQRERKPPLADLNILSIILNPADRTELHRRIERRFHDMMARGFLEEVRALHADPKLHADLPSMRAVGYRQLWRHLDGAYDLQEAVSRSIAATRQLAKRQLTWLRAQKKACWLDSGDTSVAEVIEGLC